MQKKTDKMKKKGKKKFSLIDDPPVNKRKSYINCNADHILKSYSVMTLMIFCNTNFLADLSVIPYTIK